MATDVWTVWHPRTQAITSTRANQDQASGCVWHMVIGLVRTIYIRCTYGIVGREITKYAGMYGAYMQGWTEPSNTVYTRYCWQGNYQVYGHVRCV
jgi:hypothetical protein